MPEFAERRVCGMLIFFCSRKESCPRRSSRLLVLPAMPWPGVSWISEIFSRDRFFEREALTMALDKGWRLEEASDAPRVRANVSEIPSAVVIWVMA